MSESAGAECFEAGDTAPKWLASAGAAKSSLTHCSYDNTATIVRQANVHLTLMGAEHRALYRALYCDNEVMRWIGTPLSAEVADDQFSRVVRHNARFVPGHRAWAVSRLEGDFVGMAALLRQGSQVELGIMLLPTAVRLGIGSAVVAQLVRKAFHAPEIDSIVARTRLPLAGLLSPHGFRHTTFEDGYGHWRLDRTG